MADALGEKEVGVGESPLRTETPGQLRELYNDWYFKNKDSVDARIDQDVKLDSSKPEDVKVREALRLIVFSEFLTDQVFPRMMREQRFRETRLATVKGDVVFGTSGPWVGGVWRITVNKERINKLEGQFSNDKSEFTFDDEGVAQIISFGVHEISHQFNPPSDKEEYNAVTTKYNKLRNQKEELEKLPPDDAARERLGALEKEIAEMRIKTSSLPDEYMASWWEKRVFNRFLPWSFIHTRLTEALHKATDYKRDKALQRRDGMGS